tara:strand:- start:299 stop:550 length:252 start_codon:yes stop_codon:yes gene_type:complete
MALLINSYSFVVLGLLLLMVVTSLIWRFVGVQWAVAAVAVTFTSLVAFQLMASTRIHTVSNIEQFNNALATGKPVLLEMYSNF